MFIVFFAAGGWLCFEGFWFWGQAESAFHQILAVITGGIGLVMIAAGTIDIWFWRLSGRLHDINHHLAAQPEALSSAWFSALDRRRKMRTGRPTR